MTRAAGLSQNMSAFLDAIAWSEGTTRAAICGASDDGYNMLVGSRAALPLIFDSYATHPDVYNSRFNSTAAGRYQIIFPTWSSLCVRLGLTDFSPETQDIMAVSLITEDCGAGGAVESGQFAAAVALCSSEWASLPGSASGQPQSVLDALVATYIAAGGSILA